MAAPRRRALLVGVAAAALAGRGAPAQEPWPSRPLRVVVPFAPGGIVDVLARLLADRMSRGLGQPLVVETRPGAGGNIGTALVARARGDAHLLLLGSSGPLAVSPITERNLGYDPLADLTPIVLLAATPLVLVVPAASPHRDVSGLVAAVRGGPETMFPTPGLGSPQLLASEAFRQRAGFAASPVHFTGSAPIVTAMLGGQMPWCFENLVLVLQHVREGRLRALAVTSRERAALLPDTPTMAEAGMPGFEAGGWYGLLAPAGVPTEAVSRLHAEAVAALREPEMAKRIAEMGSPDVAGTPEAFRALIADETEKWRKVLLAAGAGEGAAAPR
ncbi:MAG: tripartite tricarboxylate transporter substrate binding protein [Acetobacteraceae bacterium]|nr:tripartite tricarboxylate transporter substrate binding protein [Acetobacteraceae bacterium]